MMLKGTELNLHHGGPMSGWKRSPSVATVVLGGKVLVIDVDFAIEQLNRRLKINFTNIVLRFKKNGRLLRPCGPTSISCDPRWTSESKMNLIFVQIFVLVQGLVYLR